MAVVAWKSPRLGAGLALALIVAGSYIASLIVTEANPSTAFYMLPTRAWQLAAGGLLAVGAGSMGLVPRAFRGAFEQILAFAGWAALAALITAAIAIDSTITPYPGSAALVPTVAGVLLIASGTHPNGPGVLLRLAPIRFLGKISYSLYLWHWPILILGGLWLAGPIDTMSPAQAILLALVAIPISAASWLLVEEPFRRGKIPLPRPTRIVGVGVAAMLAVAIAGTGLNFGAQSALASLGGDDPTPEPTVLATANPDPTATPSPTPFVSLEPDATPMPTPGMTPAITPTPDPGTPKTYAITTSTRPALGKAPTDYERIWREQCLGWVRTTAPDPKCVYGNKSGTYTVALVGDSHGSALFPAVNAVATAHSWKLLPYLKIDCSFLDLDLMEYDLKRAYYECHTWNDTVIARMKANPPDLIIISMSRWIFTMGTDTVATETASLIRMIQRLPKASKVVIIQDVPLPTSVVVPDCLASYLGDYRRCSFTRKIGFGSAMGSREQGAAKATGAGLIDLTAQVCPGTGNCQPVINNVIVWRDQHHLTATFAVTLAPAVDEKLMAILSNWQNPSSPSPPPSPSA